VLFGRGVGWGSWVILISICNTGVTHVAQLYITALPLYGLLQVCRLGGDSTGSCAHAPCWARAVASAASSRVSLLMYGAQQV
jgi:hypothetical protein